LTGASAQLPAHEHFSATIATAKRTGYTVQEIVDGLCLCLITEIVCGGLLGAFDAMEESRKICAGMEEAVRAAATALGA
jgi:hypothetical protein